jgi:hypothetical protein
MYTLIIPRINANLDLCRSATIIPSGREPISVRTNIPTVLIIPDDIVSSITENVITVPHFFFCILTANSRAAGYPAAAAVSYRL